MDQYEEIIGVKERIFNATLLVGTLLGLLTFALSLRNFQESPIRLNYYATLLAITIMLMVYLLRNRFPQVVKSAAVLIGMFMLSFADIYKMGAYSNAKILLVLIPFYSLIAYDYKKIIAISIFAVALYLSFALLFVSNILDLTIDLNARTFSLSSWMVNLLLIVIVAFGVLSIVYNYNKAYIKLIKNLEEQNAELKMHRENLEGLVAERSKELELANEELTTANEELYQSKNIIETQNIELRSTLDHLQETQTKLVQSEKMASLGVLSAGVAHEINNPLNFINGGYLGLKRILKTSGIESDSNVELCLNSIKAGVERASSIVSALNQFSRSDTATNERCTAQTIIDNCLTVLSNQYDQKIVIEKQYDDTPLTITGNCGKLHHVFFNILTNAFYALNGEGKIIIATSQSDNKINVEIKDTGCGISEEHLERVTDPFFTTKDPGKGTGLGLSIAYSIIKEHNGKLEINSELNKGTCVRISFPK